MDNLIAVSSWALHRTIGSTYYDNPVSGPQGEATHSAAPTDLLEIPGLLAENGYEAMQLCHFHLPSRDPAYAGELNAALSAAGVKLMTLLIDDGDITDPEHGEASVEWTKGWIQTAASLGAKRARIIAGKQATSQETLELAISRIRELAAVAESVGVRIETENWFPLLSTPEAVHQVLDALNGSLGLCADFGNWPKPFVYEGLPQIMGRAETCHAKYEFLSPEQIDLEHADACLSIARDASFAGPFVLVSGGAGESDWQGLELQRSHIRAF